MVNGERTTGEIAFLQGARIQNHIRGLAQGPNALLAQGAKENQVATQWQSKEDIQRRLSSLLPLAFSTLTLPLLTPMARDWSRGDAKRNQDRRERGKCVVAAEILEDP